LISPGLIDELNHQVKNTLATVQSIVWQALRTATDPKAVQAAIEFRLFALSRSHDLLTRENWKSAALVDVLNDALEPFRIAGGLANRIGVNGEHVRSEAQSGNGSKADGKWSFTKVRAWKLECAPLFPIEQAQLKTAGCNGKTGESVLRIGARAL
jgi:hypothetical protein